VWAPDGQHLLFTANRHPDWRRNPLATDIFEVEVSSGELRKITGPAGPDGSPTVSPDGSLVAFLGFEDRYQGHQTTRLWVIKRDGSGLRCLSTDFDRDLSDPVFAGDGTGVHALYDHHGDTRLAFFSLDGSMRELASEVGIGGSAYSRGEFSISPGGTFAFPRTRPDTMGEIVVGTTKNDSKQPLRVVAEVNDDLFRQRKLGKVTEHWYTSSKDGRDVQAWLVHPPDFESGKQYPLILEIHGGPFANYGGRFDLEKQLWAAQGYLVLYTNPRGSTSYGEEFGNLIHHAYPGDDFFDLDSGVDMVVKSGIADPENVFVTGGSGGGVLTCWMIGRSDRFRAAATAYPVIDWTSFTLTTDIAAFVSKYWFPGLPWDHPEHYFKRSLLSVIKNVKTPTMVITGEEDWRTPISESEMYFQALQLLGVESVLVRFPGEPHGIRRRPSHHLSKIQHIVGWFDEHRTKVDLPAAVQ
jgi:acylaminoacyl-peptidase